MSGSARGEDGIAAESRRRGQLGVARAASRHGEAFLAAVERVRGKVGDASGLDVALGSKARSGLWTPRAARRGCREVVARVWSRRLLVTVVRTQSSCSSSWSSGRGSTRRCGAGLLLDVEGSTPRRGASRCSVGEGAGDVAGWRGHQGARRGSSGRWTSSLPCRGGSLWHRRWSSRSRTAALLGSRGERGGRRRRGKKRRAAARVLIRVVA